MAIEGLRTPEVRNVADEVGVAVEALDSLGLVEDREEVQESVAADFEALALSGVTGEKFVQVPRTVMSLSEIITALDGASYPEGRSYPQTYVWENLWTPGTHPGGYRENDISNLTLGLRADWPTHARIAVYDSDNDQEPLLHFLGQPFDGEHAEGGQETQINASNKAIKDYEIEHEGFEMAPLNAPAVAMIALMRRIKGEDMPMEWGFMRDATLPRVTLGGDSCVGGVYSGGGRLGFGGSGGRARPVGGVGLSVGPKELDPQAS